MRQCRPETLVRFDTSLVEKIKSLQREIDELEQGRSEIRAEFIRRDVERLQQDIAAAVKPGAMVT
jgi:hypothetical protein